MSSSSKHRYVTSTNPFEEDDDIDDDTFLRGRVPPNHLQQQQDFQQRKKEIEDRTINSTEKSLSILRDSEQIGIATAEELLRQREKLERTDKQLDEINATLRFSQKHINGIKSVFSSLKNYMSGRSEQSPTTSSSTPSTVRQSTSHEDKMNFDRYENHPATRLRTEYQSVANQGGSKEFSARFDANLQEMSSNISRLKGLAGDFNVEIDMQNDLIGNITDKAERADLSINKQSNDMKKLLRK